MSCQQIDSHSDWLMTKLSLVAFDWLLLRALATLLLGDRNQHLVVEQMFVVRALTLKKINQLLVGLELARVEELVLEQVLNPRTNHHRQMELQRVSHSDWFPRIH